jgi:endonuclease G
MKRLILALSLLLPISAAQSAASFAQCPEFFLGDRPPVSLHIQPKNTRELCYSEFAILHSGSTKTPLYVAQRMNRQTVMQAYKLDRSGDFYEEARLPSAHRAKLSDFYKKGVHRGHLAPAADMATAEGMAQSNSLANIVAKDPEFNSKVWVQVEKSVRKYIQRASGDVYVITGPLFAEQQTLKGSAVWRPSHVFKAVLDAETGRAWGWVLSNAPGRQSLTPIDYNTLVQITGMELFPVLNSTQQIRHRGN